MDYSKSSKYKVADTKNRKEYYFITKNRSGEVIELARVIKTKDELWGEFFQDGMWHESGKIVGYLVDPLPAVQISKDEALKITQQNGGKL